MIKSLETTRGSTHGVEVLKTLSGDNCNVLLVSDRTMHVLNNFAVVDVNFLVRFAESYLPSGNFYVPVDEDSDDLDFTLEIINNFRLEVSDMSCDIVAALGEITAAIITSSANCGEVTIGAGVDTGNGETGGSVPDPVGDLEFSEVDAIANRKCKAANAIVATHTGVWDDLDGYDVAQLGKLGLSALLTVVGAIIGSAIFPSVGTAIGAVAGLSISLAAQLLGLSLDLGTVVSVLTSERDNLVCALFEANDADTARGNFETVLTDEGSLSSIEIALVMSLFTNAALNILFFAFQDSESELTAYTPPFGCGTCAACFLVQKWPNVKGGGGEITPLGAGTYELGAEDDVVFGWRASLLLNNTADEGGNCGPMMAVEILSTSGGPFGDANAFRAWEDDGEGGHTEIYNSDEPWTGDLTLRYMIVKDDADFSLDVGITSP